MRQSIENASELFLNPPSNYSWYLRFLLALWASSIWVLRCEKTKFFECKFFFVKLRQFLGHGRNLRQSVSIDKPSVSFHVQLSTAEPCKAREYIIYHITFFVIHLVNPKRLEIRKNFDLLT